MKKIYVLLVSAMAVLLLMSGCSKQGDAGSNQYAFELKGNPTTGFQWVYQVDNKDILKEVRNEYIQDKTEGKDNVGVGGTYFFAFEPLKEGEVTITAKYCRSWEDVEPMATATYKLKVDKNLKIVEISKQEPPLEQIK